ncbi:MAG: glycine cleavage system protein GcvH [Rubrobacteraceae bacterium]
MSVPQELQYTESHEWVRLEEGVATIGITDHAQEELGDVVFVELPEAGSTLRVGEEFGTIESVKAVSELYAPVGGEVLEVNGELEGSPEKVNEQAYGEGWLIKVRAEEEGELMSAEDYQQLLENE